MTYFTIAAIKQANKERGHYFFSPDTMRFFNSRVLPGVIGGHFFITSEQFDWNSPRLYTVRVCHDDGSIDTVDDFQKFDTPQQARKYARSLPPYEQWVERNAA